VSCNDSEEKMLQKLIELEHRDREEKLNRERDEGNL
jgi:hypothetical protein